MTDDVNNIIKEVDEEWEKGEGGGWQSFWLLIKPAALPPFFLMCLAVVIIQLILNWPKSIVNGMKNK